MYNKICKTTIVICVFYIICVGIFGEKIPGIFDYAQKKLASAKGQVGEQNDLVMSYVEIEKNDEGIMIVVNRENSNAKKAEIEQETLNVFNPLGGKLSKWGLEKLASNRKLLDTLKKEKNPAFLINNFFTVDATTSVTQEMMNPDKLLDYDVSIAEEDKRKKIILIYHTHSSETYIDSVKGKRSDTVVGVGDYLTELLEEKGYTVIHDTTAYDVKDGKWNRESYDTALPNLKKYVKDNPGIFVTIDLHRNSGREKVVTTMNDVNVAQIMLFNGVSRNKNGSRLGLENPNLQGNLAFSLKLLMCSMDKYPDFAKKTYIKGYRYNLHLVPRALLIEVGNDKNTVAEAKAAMVLFSDILDEVLMGKY